MNVLSLFDGISGCQLALQKAGIKYNQYFASEIDKYAMSITQYNFPNTIQLGDVKNIQAKDLPKINLIVGGFPCQSFSLAGRQLNFDDPRGKLFFESARLIEECKPDYFILENVKMKLKYQDAISNCLGVLPNLLNSALVSAQNRKRLYWIGKWTGEKYESVFVSEPNDLKIYLKDILEDGFVDQDKSYCIDANYFKGGNLKSYFEKHRRQLVFSKDEMCHVGDADLKGNDTIKRVYHPEGKCPTLTTMTGGHREPKILCGAWRGRYVANGEKQDGKIKTTQRLEVREDGKTNALTTVQKDNNVVDIDNLTWRKLTPLECERLQTLPDFYTQYGINSKNETVKISNTQRYKAIGNGFTVDMIAHILKHLDL